MESVKIHFGRRSLRVDVAAFRSFFPTMPMNAWGIQSERLVDVLNAHLSGRFGITRYHIEKTLEQFFEILGGPFSSHGEGRTRLRVIAALERMLGAECVSSYAQPNGLQATRHAFIIFAYLALDFESALLAQALSCLWIGVAQTVRNCERTMYLHDWKKVQEKIQEVVNTLANPVHTGVRDLPAFPFTPWPRGRAPRNLAAPWPGHRAQSAPGARHLRDGNIRVVIPSLTSSTWTSPMMSPGRYAFDGLSNIRYQQQEMNNKLENVDEKLNWLIRHPY